MKNSGFSLLELLIVITIVGILMTIATIGFNTWQQKAQIESQTRILFATLNQARVDAMQHKQPRSVVLSSGGKSYSFQSYSSENQGRLAGVTTQAQAAKFSITEASGPADNVTEFDVRGFTSDTGTFQVLPMRTSAVVDCVVVGSGQTKMGKNTNGTTGACSLQ